VGTSESKDSESTDGWCSHGSLCRVRRRNFPLHFHPSGLFVADFDLFVAFFHFFLCVSEGRPYQN
jgi:hypothetical protein